MNRAGTRTAAAALIGLMLTLVVAVVPSVYFAYRAHLLRAVLETAVTLVGCLVAILCYGRYRRSRDSDDLGIVAAMLLFALAFPLFSALPLAILAGPAERIGHWVPLGLNVMAATLLALASTNRTRSASSSAIRKGWDKFLVPVLVIAAAIAILVLLAPRQGPALLRPELSESPHPFASPLLAAVQFGGAVFFAIAAARVAKAARGGDAFLEWLGIGCALMAVASLNYAMFPSFNVGLLNTGDLFRSAAVAAWAVGAIEEIVSYWSQVARLARVEERRKLARDLHDGLAQELAFLVTHVQFPADVLTDPKWLAQLKTGAERALAESRRAIVALTADTPPSLEVDLGRTAHDVAGRTGVAIDLDVAHRAVDADYQENLVRIVREAVTNAIRHGQADRVSIQYTGGSQPVLTVCDDGIGFDPAKIEAVSDGYGIVCMRERAETLGATLALRSTPGKGATVEIAWP